MTAGQESPAAVQTAATSATEKATGWLTVGRDEPHPPLRMLSGGAT
jgi:hypothetical protein